MMAKNISTLRLLVTFSILVFQIQSQFYYKLQIQKNIQKQSCNFKIIDQDFYQKNLHQNIHYNDLTLIQINLSEKIQKKNFSLLHIIVQIQIYETGTKEIVSLQKGNSECCTQNECNCDIKQREDSKLPLYKKENELFQYQNAKTIAKFSEKIDTLYVLLLLYDEYSNNYLQQKEIFINYDYDVYFIDLQYIHSNFYKISSTEKECDLLASKLKLTENYLSTEDPNYNQVEQERLKRLRVFYNNCPQNFEEENFFFSISWEGCFYFINFNINNEPKQQLFEVDFQHKLNSDEIFDKVLNQICYDKSLPKEKILDTIFLVVQRTQHYKYKISRVQFQKSTLIAISEISPIQSLTRNLQNGWYHHYTISLKIVEIIQQDDEIKTEIEIEITDLYQQQMRISKIFQIQNINKYKIIKVLFNIKNEDHYFLIDYSSENKFKKQTFFFQSLHKLTNMFQIYFSHQKYSQVKKLISDTSAFVYQLSIYYFAVSNLKYIQNLDMQGTLVYFDCNQQQQIDQDLTNEDIEKLQLECQKYLDSNKKKILMLSQNEIECSVNISELHNKLYNMYFIQKKKTFDENYEAKIMDVIKVDRRFSHFQVFHYMNNFQPLQNFKCSLQVIDNRIYATFSKSFKKHSLLFKKKSTTLIVKSAENSKNEFKCEIKNLNPEEPLINIVQNKELIFGIENLKFNHKFVQQNSLFKDQDEFYLPLMIADPRNILQNADQFHVVQKRKFNLQNYNYFINNLVNSLKCFTNFSKNLFYIFLQSSLDQNDFYCNSQEDLYIKIDILKQQKQLIMSYMQNKIQINTKNYTKLIENYNFQQLHLNVFFQENQNGEQKKKFTQENFDFEIVQKIDKSFIIMKFRREIYDKIQKLFDGSRKKLYFFEQLQKNSDLQQKQNIEEFSEFDSESKSFSEIEEINGDIFMLRLTNIAAIEQQVLIHYKMKINSSRVHFTKSILQNKFHDSRLSMSIVNKSEQKEDKYVNFYDRLIDPDLDEHVEIYCASPLVDIDFTCPLNDKTFEFIEVNYEENEFDEQNKFLDDKKGFVFTLFLPKGQLFVMDFIYNQAGTNVIQNCIAIIFTQHNIYISSSNSEFDLQSYYIQNKSNIDKGKDDIIKKIFRPLQIDKSQKKQQNDFFELLQKQVKIIANIQAFNTGDKGETDRISQLKKKIISAIQSRKALKIRQYNDLQGQDILSYQKNLKLTSKEISQIQNTIDLQEESSEINKNQEIIIKTVPIVFNLDTEEKNIQQRPNNILKIKKQLSSYKITNNNKYQVEFEFKLMMTVDSFNTKYLRSDMLKDKEQAEQVEIAKQRRQQNLERIKSYLAEQGIINTEETDLEIKKLFDQQDSFTQRFNEEF